MKVFTNSKVCNPKSIFTILFCLLSIFIIELNAQIKFPTVVRISSENTSWHDAKMWDCSCIPNAEQDVIIPGHSVVILESAMAKSLSITNGEHDAIVTVTSGKSITILNDLNIQTNPKTGKSAVLQTEGSGAIAVNGNVNMSRPELYDRAGKLQLSLTANSTMAVTGNFNIASTGSSIEENNSEIRLSGNSNLSVLGNLDINSTGTTKGVEVELRSGVGSSPELSIESNLFAYSNSAGALKLDIQANGKVSVGSDVEFNIAGANTDFQLLVGEAGTAAEFNAGGKLAVSTVSSIESKVRVRGASQLNIIGDLELKMEKIATKLSVDLGEFGGAAKLAVQGKFATLNTSSGELLTDVRGVSALDVDGDFELKGIEGSATTMTKVRVRSFAKATFQKSVRLMALSSATNIEFNVEENAEATVKENLEMSALANGKVKVAMMSQAKLMVAKNFERPNLYGSLSMEENSTLVLNGTECGQKVPAAQVLGSGDKFDMSNLELSNDSSCGITLEATPFKRTFVKRIKLVKGLVNLNGQTLLITDTDPEAIDKVDGCFMGDGTEDFESKLMWDLGQTGVKYTYPLCNENMEALDVSITPTCEMGRTTVATYKTQTTNSPNNRPLPSGFTSFDYNGQEAAPYFVDRFYCVEPANVHNGCAEIELAYTTEDLANNPEIIEDDIRVHNLSVFGLSEPRGEKIAGNKASFTLRPGEASRFTLGSIQTALPVKFASFNAIKEGQKTKLEWTTASEVNNDIFRIERSSNNSNWTTVAIEDGAGNSTEVLDYSVYDRQPERGINYYRIAQSDFNGDISYSDIRSISFEANSSRLVSISPNPVSISNGTFKLKLEGVELEENISLILYNSVGQVIKNENYTTANELNVNIEGVATGMYYAKVSSSLGLIKTIPLVVQ